MKNVLLIYLGGALFGIFMSTFYPLAISYPTIFNMKMTGFHTSLCATFASFGEVVLPYFIGYIIS